MKRRIFNAIAVASAVLCVAMVGLWVRSYSTGDQVAFSGSNYIFGISSNEGWLWFYKGRRFLPNRDGEGFIYRSSPPPVRPADRISNWNEVYTGDHAWGASYRCFVVAAWKVSSILLLLAARPLLISAESAIRKWWRSNNERNRGICRRCGYDLRATPERCPECGTVPDGIVPSPGTLGEGEGSSAAASCLRHPAKPSPPPSPRVLGKGVRGQITSK